MRRRISKAVKKAGRKAKAGIRKAASSKKGRALIARGKGMAVKQGTKLAMRAKAKLMKM